MVTKIYEYIDNGNRYFKEKPIYCGSGWENLVEIPEFLNPYESITGDTVIEPDDSYPQFLSDCLRVNTTQGPCLCVTYSKNVPVFKYYNLKVISREEVNLVRYL